MLTDCITQLNKSKSQNIFSHLFYQSALKISKIIPFCIDKILAVIYRNCMGYCGKNVMLRPMSSVFKGLENIYIEGDVRIARYATIYTTRAKVFIGQKVGIAPYLKIITGNHRINRIGHYMFDGDNDKRPSDDKDVIIEGDNWFGINVTILSGVTVGRGTVIAAGSVLTKSVPPYSIVGGVPAKVIKYRFTIDEALEHEKKLYPTEKRYTREELLRSRT